uniref:DUF4408 domain-containing protein n=1 Tax=Heterorhabditis bacteriophora TaxID=37862 RepID=A0A1I7WVJ8_HETBA
MHNHGARTLASGSKQLSERMPLQPLSAMEDVERQKEKPIQVFLFYYISGDIVIYSLCNIYFKDAIKPFVFSLNPEEEFAEDMAFPNKKMMLFDFFAAHEKELEKEAVDKEEEEEMYAQSAFAKRRMSLAKSKVSVTSAPKQVGPASVSKVLAAERSMERALCEMNLADSSTTSPSGLPIAANDLDKTGIGLAYMKYHLALGKYMFVLRSRIEYRKDLFLPILSAVLCSDVDKLLSTPVRPQVTLRKSRHID